MGHVLGDALQQTVDLSGAHGLRNMAQAATNFDPLNIIPDGIQKPIDQYAPLALNLIPGVGPAVYAGYTAAKNYGNGGSAGSSLASGAKSYALSEGAGALSDYLGGGSSLSGSQGSGSLTGSAGVDTLGDGLQSGSYLSPGASSAGTYNIGGGGASSFGAGDVTKQFADGLAGTSGYTPNFASIASSAPSSGIGSFLSNNATPLLAGAGAASSLASNYAAQNQLKKATNQANDQLNPYLQNGSAASGAISNYLGLGGNGATSEDILKASPGYQFQLDQGNRALAAQQAASGSLNSGAAMKAAQQFGTGLASQTAQQYLGNLQNTANQGLSAAGQYGNNTTAMGSAGANANIASGNTISQLLSGVGGKNVIGYDAKGQPIYSK